MKKILILLVALTALYSCKKSSDATVGPDPVVVPTTASLLLGQWKYLRDSTITYANGSSTTQQTTYTNASILFNKDFTGVDVNTSFFYNLSGMQLSLNYPAYQSTTVNGVTTTIPEVTNTATITVISATKLTLYYDFTGKDGNGVKSGSSVYSFYSK